MLTVPISNESIIDTHLGVLPFSGFGQTIHELYLDSWVENELHAREIDDDDEELTGEEIRSYCVAYANAYTVEFCKLYGIKATIESLEQNKTGYGERIFINIPVTETQRLWRLTNPENLANTLKELYTARSGFIPYYENTIKDWMSQAGGINYWDHNEIYTVLLAYVTQNGFNSDIEAAIAETASAVIV
jgi:hypothetical protein